MTGKQRRRKVTEPKNTEMQQKIGVFVTQWIKEIEWRDTFSNPQTHTQGILKYITTKKEEQ